MRRGAESGAATGILAVLATGWMLAWMPADGEAQLRGTERRPRAEAGVSFVVADPQGEMGRLVDQGFGAQGYGSWALDRAGHVRVRGDLGFVVYGHERFRSCFGAPVGCRIEMDLTTTNTIFYGGLGPELVLATGRLQPYVNAGFGFTWFATTSSLSGVDEWDDWANTTNYSDAGFAWRAGGGLRVGLTRGRTPVSLDLSVERHDNGIMEYLTEGDIVDNPDGSVTLLPTRSEADLVTVRIGVSVGIPSGRDDDRDRRRRRR